MHRRGLLALAASVTTVGLAGCSGGDDTDGGDNGDSAEAGNGDSDGTVEEPAGTPASVVDEFYSLTREYGDDGIESRFEGYLPATAEDAIAAVAERNAVIQAQVDFTNGDSATQRWLVTPADGEWVIFVGGGS